METADSVVSDILQEILVQSSEQAVQAVDGQTVIRYMNRFMSEIDAGLGISLGYTEVTSLADPITIADGAINGLIFNTALRLLSSYDVIPNAFLVTSAASGLKAMRKIARNPRVTAHPSTLPIGSGNEGFSNFNTTHFYPGEEPSILTEQNGNILLEDSTNDQ